MLLCWFVLHCIHFYAVLLALAGSEYGLGMTKAKHRAPFQSR